MIEAEAMDGGDGGREGEDDGNIRPGLDPFVQPPILKVFFEQLPMEELAKCRLVNKLWCNESLSTWRSNATLKFEKEGLVSTRDDGSRLTTSLGEFLDLWDAGEWDSCPFKKFSLDHWIFKAGDVEQQRFLALVGAHLTSLTLEWCSFVGRNNFRRIIYQAFPNLQFLEINNCDVNKVSYYWDEPTEEIRVYEEPAFGVHGLKSLDLYSCLPDSLMAILSHFHKLKSLQVAVFAEGGDYYWDLLETIRVIRAQDQTKLPLKNIDVVLDFHSDPLYTTTSIEIVKLHEQLNLPLQRFKLDLEPEEEEEEDMNWDFNDGIRDILRQHSSTLKHLEFTGNGAQGLCKSFPYGFCLENLEEFYIQSPCFTDNLNYLRYTPHLRELDISVNTLSTSESESLFSNSSQLEIGEWALPSLIDLNLGFPVSLRNVRKLVKWMPNVERSMGLQLDDVKFSMVCENWKNLKYLRDGGKELTDAGVIGIKDAHDSEGSPTPANITKLKNLTSFETRSSKLTSASVHDGFLKLANLKELSLGDATKLDDEAKAALEGRSIRLGP